jgi:CxxC-x17-CxxC domain-containing protein
MTDFKRNDRFGDKRSGGGYAQKPFGRPSFGGKPSFGRGGAVSGRPQAQMYPATCAQCGNATEVPFRPDGKRPIYCRNCFGGKDAVASRAPASTERAPQAPIVGRSYEKSPLRVPVSVPPPPAKPDPRIDTILSELTKLQHTVNQILLGIVVAKAQVGIEASAAKPKRKPAPAKKKK